VIMLIPGNQREGGPRDGVIGTSVALASGTAYFSYLGYVSFPFTPKHLGFHMNAAGTGAQTAELGLFSSPGSPNRAAMTLTKLIADAVVDSLTAAGPLIRRNTNPWATLIPAGTHLWGGLRVAMAATQPTIGAVGGDMLQGYSQWCAASGVLTGLGPFVCTIPTTAIGGGAYSPAASVGPYLRWMLDT
jgi:hypothetical protein